MGWQRQEHGPSIQQALEKALERMTGEQAQFTAAGRTDAGVHALAMTAHVDVMKSLTPHRFREGLNALVRPQPVSVLEVAEVADDWHARFSCVGRRYLYRILESPGAACAGWRSGLAYCRPPRRRSDGRRREPSRRRHDFTTFRSAQCQSDSPVKTLDRARGQRAWAKKSTSQPRREASSITRCARWSVACRWSGAASGGRTIWRKRWRRGIGRRSDSMRLRMASTSSRQFTPSDLFGSERFEFLRR